MKRRSVSGDGSFMVVNIKRIIHFLVSADVDDVNKVPVRTTSEAIRGRTDGMNRVAQTGKILIFSKGCVEVESLSVVAHGYVGTLNRRGIELGRGRYTPTRGLERKEGRVQNNYIETEAGGRRIKKEKNKKTAKRDEVRAFHDGTMRGGQ